MKINRVILPLNKEVVLEDDVILSKDSCYYSNQILDASPVHVKASLFETGEFLTVNLNVSCDLKLQCAYTLEEVPYKLRFNETIEITDDPNDEEMIYINKNQFSIDDIILSLVSIHIPLKVVKKGAKLPSSGKNYRVLTEEEVFEEQERDIFDDLPDIN